MYKLYETRKTTPRDANDQIMVAMFGTTNNIRSNRAAMMLDEKDGWTVGVILESLLQVFLVLEIHSTYCSSGVNSLCSAVFLSEGNARAHLCASLLHISEVTKL